MLFDLRSRGRRRTVQGIYLMLAILLGGGLVFFGIGSNTSGGGLFDALSGSGGSGSGDVVKKLDKRLDTAAKRAAANPKDPEALRNLSSLRLQRANLSGVTTAAGRTKLDLSYAAWESYLALAPSKQDVTLATLLWKAYEEPKANDPKKATRALQVVTGNTKPPSFSLYTQLSVLAYRAKDTRLSDLARDRALALGTPDEDKSVRAYIKNGKAQADAAASQTAPPAAG